MTADDRHPITDTSPERPITRTAAARAAYVGLGWLCVAIGGVGVVVPGLPTTVFLLAALWAFARGSARFHDWLYAHPRFGPPLQAWRRHGVIRPAAKILAVSMMALSFGLVLAASSGPLLPGLTAMLLTGAAGYVLSRPSRPPVEG